MSKKEILKVAEQWLLKHPTLYLHDLESHDEGGYLGINENILYQIMTEFADQEKEKVAVAFAEWKDNCYCFDALNGYYVSVYFDFECQTLSDLYQYFITNVYNK